MKKNQGITLIALVITIIVLLILAGVSIALLTGDNGILTKANNASEQTKEQGALEKVKIAIGSSYGVNGLDKTELKPNIEKVEGIDKSTIKDTLPMTVKVDGIEVYIDENGKATLGNSQNQGPTGGEWTGTANKYANGSWNGDYSVFPNTGTPFFVRGGAFNVGSVAGVFAFSSTYGAHDVSSGFRVCLAI